MKRIFFVYLGLLLLSFKCTSDSEFSDYSVFNGMHKDILVLSQKEFSNLEGKTIIDPDKSYISLVEPFDTKEFNLSDLNYAKVSAKEGDLIFYFINETNFKKTFEEIKRKKLYDSLSIPTEKIDLENPNNYMFKFDNYEWTFTHYNQDFIKIREVEALKD